jgi:hypothetical protein
MPVSFVSVWELASLLVVDDIILVRCLFCEVCLVENA